MVAARDVLLSDAAARALDDLERRAARGDRKAASVARRARSLRAILLADALHGEVARRPLPRELVARHGIANLYVEDLPDFWRLLYTIIRQNDRAFVVVVEIVDHGTYDRWFPGRGK